MPFRYLLIFLLCFCPYLVVGQNLLSNHSFESYTICPGSLGEIYRCLGWRNYHAGTSDYFHQCNTIGAGVPSNSFGNESAVSGKAYIGVFTYTPLGKNYKEYIASAITPMLQGGRYEVSIFVSLSDRSMYGTNDLGVWFYDKGPSTSVSGTDKVLNVIPQVSYSSYGAITQQSGWMRLTGLFVADSAYDNIVIGGFKDSTSIIAAPVAGTLNYGYYYIDSVTVLLDNRILLNFPDTLLCAGDTFYVPFGIKPNYTFNSGNIFTVQLSNLSGSFANPIVLGSLNSTTAGSIKCVIPNTIISGTGYKIRIMSSNIVDSSVNTGKLTLGIINPPKPLAGSNGPLCTGDILRLTASNSTTAQAYIWKGPNGYVNTTQNPHTNNVSLSDSGIYIVSAYLYGCASKDTILVAVHQMPLPITASGPDTICELDTLQLVSSVSSAGAKYTWNGPGGFTSYQKDTFISHAISIQSGDYIITASLGTVCEQKDTINVLVKPLPDSIVTNSNAPICEKDTLQLNASSSTTGVDFSWSGPNSFSSVSDSNTKYNAVLADAGVYFVTYTLNGCSLKDSINVPINNNPLPVATSTNAPICEDMLLRLFSTNSSLGAEYSWNGPGGFISSLQNPVISNPTPYQTGTYKLTVRLLNGCIYEDSIPVLVNSLPANLVAAKSNPLCEGKAMQLSAASTSPGVIYHWYGPNNFKSDDSMTIINLLTQAHSGKYFLVGTLGDCSDTLELDADILNPILNLGNDTLLCHSQMLLLQPNVENATYIWSNGSMSPTFEISRTGTYSVTAETPCGTLTDSIKIQFEHCDCNVDVPSAFTPNNDGLNDKLGAIVRCEISSYLFAIANRWGQVVFTTNDMNQKWDGRHNGKDAEIGMYAYAVQIITANGLKKIFKGDITLLR